MLPPRNEMFDRLRLEFEVPEVVLWSLSSATMFAMLCDLTEE